MMRLKSILASACAIAALAAPAAFANDSTAELAQGGLVLKKADGIAMKSEDLFISQDAVKVKYQFLNTSGHDQKVVVAFPLPEITTEGEDDNIAIPDMDKDNFVDFHTTVDGVPVQAMIEQKAFKNGVDQTALLKSLGVPLAPLQATTGQALDKLSPADAQKLVKLEMAVDQEYDVGKGMEHHYGAAWTLKTTYYWEQVFPAGKIVHVNHDYKPSVGSSAGTSLEMAEFQTQPEFKTMQAKYCIDSDFMASVAKRKKEVGEDHQGYFEQRIDYILKTAANWSEPIGDFRLVLDKGKADSIMSVCETGIKKITPTQFEVHRTNFTPKEDLHILILVRPDPGY